MPKFNRVPDTAEVYLTAIWLAAIAHPDSAEGYFRDRAKDAYRTIYGKEITDAQLDSILEKEANKSSASYSDLFG